MQGRGVGVTTRPHSEVLAVDTGVEGSRRRKPETEVFEVGVEKEIGFVEDHLGFQRVIEIPEIEFYAGGDMKRQIDSVYNHLSQACFNGVARTTHGDLPVNPEEQQGILGTIQRLRQMLDLEEPCTIVIRCPTGETAFKPMDGIEVLPLDASVEGTVLMTDDRRN